MKSWCWTSPEASFLDVKTATSSPSYGLFFRHKTLVSQCIQIYCFYKDTTQIGLEPTLMASFEFKHLFKDLASKYNLILKFRGLWLQYINLEGKGHNLDHTNGHAITFIVSPKTWPSLKTQFCAHYSSCSLIKLSQWQGQFKPFLLAKYFHLGRATPNCYFAGMMSCWSLGRVYNRPQLHMASCQIQNGVAGFVE